MEPQDPVFRACVAVWPSEPNQRAIRGMAQQAQLATLNFANRCSHGPGPPCHSSWLTFPFPPFQVVCFWPFGDFAITWHASFQPDIFFSFAPTLTHLLSLHATLFPNP